MSKTVRIGSERTGYVQVGRGFPCAVMAEVGLNHDGDLGKALHLVDLAVDSGADLVKFQYLDPEVMVLRESLPEVYEIYRKHSLSLEEMRKVSQACRKHRTPFVCTVFDLEGAARLVEIRVDAFKIASCDMTHLPLLRGLGQFGLPVILSTGLANLAEVSRSVRELKQGGARTPVLLHCLSAYPAPSEQINLRAMETLRRRFSLPAGYSDHTAGVLAPVVAVALGAAILEKHFTYDPSAPGPDHALSLGPEDFRLMVDNLRLAEQMLGHGRKKPARAELEERGRGRRGYYLRRDVKSGEKVSPEDLAALKPVARISPSEYRRLRGAVYARDLEKGSPLRPGDLSRPLRD